MTIRIDGTNTTASPGITGTDTDTGLQFGSDEVTIVTGGNDRVEIDSSGNLKLQSSGNYMLTEGTTDAFSISTNGANGHLRITDEFNSTERLRIENSGKVGIGESSPNALLDVNSSTAGNEVLRLEGNYTASGDVTLTNWRRNGGAVSAAFQYHDSLTAMSIGTTTGHSFALRTNDSERMRINANGTVDMDVAGTYQGKQTEAHYTNNNFSNQWIQYIQHTGTSPYGITIRYKGTNVAPNNNSNDYIHCEDFNANRFSVRSNGSVDSAANSYGGYSDIKLKENIVDAPSQWSDLKDIKVRNFNFTEESGLNGGKFLGVIAQEVELVSAGLVSDIPDRDEDNQPTGTSTKSVKYSVLYMKAIKALQEAMERIETLETQNSSLEARLTALEGGAS